MKRKRLAELVREEAEGLKEAIPEPAPAERRAEPAPPEPPKERPTPKYLTYVRKECRLRPDQLDALTALARKLNRERARLGLRARVTENTLIRIAVRFLLKKPSLFLNEKSLLEEEEDCYEA
ncbi:chromosome segregation ATPase (plasmid) [Thermus sp. CCB_US3_UF1]|uniref:hypothetical protein n=1 Tax=Thermus sp. CCB_US3_UF1 TaxID=1111069 RepID=UPI00023893FD|nr:hypothetical protein [Thermus sp. CCB_US3_UF1]AEV17313.1 chromosome segregation ATPase [Thermus sp. CCB_US3_UF1]